MKYIMISTLLLIFTSCATGTKDTKTDSQIENKPTIPSAITSNQHIEISQIGF